jgi:S-formylglutathione hydrolase FrmB
MAAALLLSSAPLLLGGIFDKDDTGLLDRVNSRIQGRVVDYTHNHGQDLRIFSKALQKPQDMYVYLPPSYDAGKRYPLLILLHGVLEDERGFLKHGVEPLDQAIACGIVPPLIVAIPDGSLEGTNHHLNPNSMSAGSFFINGPAGNYQDWIVNDVWEFMTTNYPIRPERAAHVIAGGSMGGFGAYNIALKHRDRFQIVMGILPALNLRYIDKYKQHCRVKFDPGRWGWRDTPADPNEIIGAFAGGLILVKMKDVIFPAFGAGWEGLQRASEENPIELVERLNLKDGELDMYVGYAGRDEFHLDAQAESFIFYCQTKGIKLTVYYDAHGNHSERTAARMAPNLLMWLGERLRAHGIDQPVDK